MPPGLSSSTTLKRIHREIADLKKEDLGAITLTPSDENIFNWKATIPGPQGSVYEGGVFDVDINLANDYPFSAPRVAFKTRIYHMNISDRGGVCIDILKQNWSPALSLFKVILSLSSLLTDPNPKDPLVPTIAKEYLSNRRKHDETAREWTRLYALPRLPPPAPTPSPAVVTTTTRAKGKARTPTTVIGSSSRVRPSPAVGSRVPAETIVIDDSDDDMSGSSRGAPPRVVKRKRGAPGNDPADIDVAEGGTSRQRKRGRETSAPTADDEVIIIDD